jgi:hypothetical protein
VEKTRIKYYNKVGYVCKSERDGYMDIKVPDLMAGSALDFCKYLNSIDLINREEKICFDFASVRTCDPFPMLIVSHEIRNRVNQINRLNCYARNCNNTYANHMKFYKACGLNQGEEVEVSRGNSKYSSITKMSVTDLKNEGANNLDVIQEVIEKKAKTMASIVAQGNKKFEQWLSFVIREIIRNIPEHSKSDTIWYCAQYWPSYDLVELAIMDEGIGIKESLCENVNNIKEANTDENAIRLSLKPGISGTNINRNFIQSEWDNSGYGLYMVSEMCAELDASFIIASGDSAIRVKKVNGQIEQESFDTKVHGTAIQIRIRPSSTVDYDEIRRKIVLRGEKVAKKNAMAIHVASKSSRGF